ncbi:MAG: XisH protein [Pegethrix bostrychoides GSE-TBD4-15B]|uniref:XisH protein n=1 Tax=Pegethrix bostrychoides GSE-TBD4-15B TaxID=2839662 RepID=A0A951PA20_9CYAN|nr:XisH protein [Pegethrix bostrychoides GSE-TBD4-15B]
MEYGEDRLFADIAAEKTLAAEKRGRRIIVEVKSFLGRSFIQDLEKAVGQYLIYRDILEETDLDFTIYMGFTRGVWKSNFQRKLAQMIIQRHRLKLLIIDSQKEEVEQWIE